MLYLRAFRSIAGYNKWQARNGNIRRGVMGLNAERRMRDRSVEAKAQMVEARDAWLNRPKMRRNAEVRRKGDAGQLSQDKMR
jgi:hypothetical protein